MDNSSQTADSQLSTEQDGTGANPAPAVARDEYGKILPGHSLNPGGRPKSKRIREAMLRRLEEEGAESVAEIPFKIALNPKERARDRLSAAQEIADRTEGKPMQSHKIEATIDEGAVARLAEMISVLPAYLLSEEEGQQEEQ